MAKRVRVTKAQQKAARIVVARSAKTGKSVTSSVMKIAAAESPTPMSVKSGR